MKAGNTILSLIGMTTILTGCSNRNAEVEAANTRAKIAEADAARFKAEAENTKLHQQIASTGNASNSSGNVTSNGSTTVPSSTQNTNLNSAPNESSREQLRSKVQGHWISSDNDKMLDIMSESWTWFSIKQGKVTDKGTWTITDAGNVTAASNSDDEAGKKLHFEYHASDDTLQFIFAGGTVNFKRK